VKNNKHIYTVEMMCRVLEISQSAYYNWQSGRSRKREIYKKTMQTQIQFIYFQHKGRYGSPRIGEELRRSNIRISNPTVAKYMKEMGLKSKRSRKFVVTTDSRHKYNVCENVLNRCFDATFVSDVWVSDITYIQTLQGFLYLTVIVDLFDRKVIGWSICDGLTAEETTLSAFRMAVKIRPPQKGLIFHSDRGIQYCCNSFVNKVSKYGIIQSMCRKGDCWDNAVAESFFKTLKTELIYGNRLVSKEEMRSMLFEYIEIYYNQNRRHSALGNLTIKEFTKLMFKNVA